MCEIVKKLREQAREYEALAEEIEKFQEGEAKGAGDSKPAPEKAEGE